MRFLLATLLTAVLAYLAGLVLPWWSIAIIAFAVALLVRQSILAAFLSGFAGIFIFWAVLSLWIDTKNESLLSHKIAQIIPLGGSSALLILVTAFVGGLVGAFAAMAGSSLMPARRPRRR